MVPALLSWPAFVTEFTSYFRLFDPARDAQVKLAWIKQMDNKAFAMFINSICIETAFLRFRMEMVVSQSL